MHRTTAGAAVPALEATLDITRLHHGVGVMATALKSFLPAQWGPPVGFNHRTPLHRIHQKSAEVPSVQLRIKDF